MTAKKKITGPLKELPFGEKFTKMVIDNMPVGIAVNSISPELKALYMNDNFARIYRTTREKLYDPDSFWDAVYEDPVFREKIKKRVLDDIASGDPERLLWENIPITRKGEETAYITAYNTPVTDENIWISVVIDVTDRKRAEDKLRESEEKHRRMFETLSQGIIYQDARGSIISANPAAERILGLSLDQMLGKTSTDPRWKMIREDGSLVAGDEHPAMIALKTGKKVGPVIRGVYRPEADTYVWLTIVAIPLFQPGETTPFQAYATIEDITEKRTAEEKLHRWYKIMEHIIRHDPNAIAVHDKNLNYLFVSERYLQDYGVQESEIIGRHHYDIFPDIPEKWKEVHQRALNGEVIRSDEDRFLRKDGRTDYTRWECRPWYENENEIGGIVLYTEVITGRKQAEIALRESEAQYRTLIENSNDAIYLLYNRKFEIINRRFEEMFGYTIEEVNSAGFDFIRLVAPESRHLIEDYQREIASGAIIDPMYEFTAIDKEGNRLEVETSVSLINYKNGKAIQGIIRDVSERKAMIAELVRAKEKAEESDRLKSAFLQNISHEIRTPMNAIVGFSEFLENTDLSPVKQREYAGIISHSSNQLLGIISDILSIATLESGQEKIKESEVDINQICTLVHNHFSGKAADRNITLEFTGKLQGEDAKTITDGTKLQQVISNLVDNAIKYTHEGGVTFGYRPAEDMVEFFIEDTGIGISPEFHETIFERFRQVEEPNSRHYGGSGLGLSIAKAYVELMGGKIWLTSVPGKGTTFYFTIPAATRNEKTQTCEKPGRITLEYDNNKTILVAEDVELNYILLEEILKEINVRVCHAVNGAKAVEMCSSGQQIDLILMDIKMPVMSGHEATKKIREFNPEIPIIAQTAYTSDQDIQTALECGCNAFISKPINREELIIKIRTFLENTG